MFQKILNLVYDLGPTSSVKSSVALKTYFEKSTTQSHD